MATGKKTTSAAKKITPKPEEVRMENAVDESKLDAQEEKILDWILKGVVAFVLGWLGLAVLMVLGGYFHLWG